MTNISPFSEHTGINMATSDEDDNGDIRGVPSTIKRDRNFSEIRSQEMHVQTRQVLQTIATLEMYRAQREAANYFELAYLCLADHPEEARQVRLTAHAARTQHLMTSGLMKKFTLTAAHIVNTMIPMINDAITELKSAAVVKDVFGQIIEIVEEMKVETESTQKRYFEIQGQIQENMASVNKRNKHVVDEQKRLCFEIDREKQLAEADKLAQEEIEEERKRMDKELEKLQSTRDNLEMKAETASNALNNGGETFLDSALILGPALCGGPQGIALGLMASTANILTGLFRSEIKQKNFSKLMDAYRSSQTAVEKSLDKRLDVIIKMQEQRRAALERLETIKLLGSQAETLGNVESLQEVLVKLGNVDKQFTRIIEFWSGMSAVLKILRDDTTSSKAYLVQIENPAMTSRFRQSIERAENAWKFFERMCNDYVEESDAAISSLYHFLSAPIDNMEAKKRNQRQQQLMLEIEDDINKTYPNENDDN